MLLYYLNVYSINYVQEQFSGEIVPRCSGPSIISSTPSTRLIKQPLFLYSPSSPRTSPLLAVTNEQLLDSPPLLHPLLPAE